MDSKIRRDCGLALIVLLNFGGLSVVASADNPIEFKSESNPYSVILERNVFHLNPPPPPPAPGRAAGPKPPVATFTGLLQMGGQWKALLVVTSPNPDPHSHELISYLTLAEGEKQSLVDGAQQATLELIRIRPREGEIDIIDMGEAMTLSLAADSLESKDPYKQARNLSMIEDKKRSFMLQRNDPAYLRLKPAMLRVGESPRRLLGYPQGPAPAPVKATEPDPNASTTNGSTGIMNEPTVDQKDTDGANTVIVGGGGSIR